LAAAAIGSINVDKIKTRFNLMVTISRKIQLLKQRLIPAAPKPKEQLLAVPKTTTLLSN
jgi:hypothetical protein